jgi:hypothetical protein
MTAGCPRGAPPSSRAWQSVDAGVQVHPRRAVVACMGERVHTRAPRLGGPGVGMIVERWLRVGPGVGMIVERRLRVGPGVGMIVERRLRQLDQ